MVYDEFRNGNYDAINPYLATVNWNYLFSNKNINDFVTPFYEIIALKKIGYRNFINKIENNL